MAKTKPKPKPVVVPTPDRLIRAFTLPVRDVVEPDGVRVIDAFRRAWRLSTDLANWCQRELALHDKGLRTPAAEKITRYDPKPFPGGRSLYQWVTKECPFRGDFDGAAQSMNAVLKAVEDAWRSHPRFGRFAVLWKGEARPAVFRFPYPWPVPSQSLRVYRDATGRPCASITLPGGRVAVRLGDGPDFRRQLRQFDAMLADPSRLKQAKATARFTAGKMVGVGLRIVGSFDAPPPAAGDLAGLARTDPNALLVVEVPGRSPWVLNCDHVRRLHVSHKARLQRLAEDTKREKRLSRSERDGINGRRDRLCDKHQKRMDTALHQISAQVAGYCHRSGLATLVYDDANKGYIPEGFPWSAMRDRVRYKLAGVGVGVVDGQSQGSDQE